MPSWSGWLLIGLGGYLAFMAKPQTAAGLALAVSLWTILLHGRRVPKGLALAIIVAFGLTLVSALTLDGSVGGFIARFQRVLEIEAITKTHVGPGLIVVGLDFLRAAYWPKAALFLAALVGWGVALARLSDSPRKGLWFLLVAVSALAAAGWLLLLPETLSFSYAKGLLVGLSPLGLIVHDRFLAPRTPRDRARIGRALLLLCLAFLFVVGSNNPAAIGLSLATLLVFASLTLLAVKPGNGSVFRLAGLTLMGVVILASIMSATWRRPYRQLSPLWAADVPTGVPEWGGKLRLPENQALFLESVYEITDRSGFEPGAVVIDLTGRMPGVIYAMGGIFPQAAWLGSGYRGSRAGAVLALGRLSCVELASAWLIMAEEPEPYHFDPGILAEAGLEFDNHYQLVGTARLPVAIGERDFAFRELLFLKPMADWPVRAQACVAARAGAGSPADLIGAPQTHAPPAGAPQTSPPPASPAEP